MNAEGDPRSEADPLSGGDDHMQMGMAAETGAAMAAAGKKGFFSSPGQNEPAALSLAGSALRTRTEMAPSAAAVLSSSATMRAGVGASEGGVGFCYPT